MYEINREIFKYIFQNSIFALKNCLWVNDLKFICLSFLNFAQKYCSKFNRYTNFRVDSLFAEMSCIFYDNSVSFFPVKYRQNLAEIHSFALHVIKINERNSTLLLLPARQSQNSLYFDYFPKYLLRLFSLNVIIV